MIILSGWSYKMSFSRILVYILALEVHLGFSVPCVYNIVCTFRLTLGTLSMSSFMERESNYIDRILLNKRTTTID